jgi:hypothetical protein
MYNGRGPIDIAACQSWECSRQSTPGADGQDTRSGERASSDSRSKQEYSPKILMLFSMAHSFSFLNLNDQQHEKMHSAKRPPR